MSNSNYLTIPNLSASVIQRFFSKVKIDTKTGCWLWTAGKDRDGYGHFYYKRKTHKAHRFLYSWLIAPLPKGCSRKTPQLHHDICENPSCVNPWHLKLISPREHILVGNSFSAINSKKTCCPEGHLFTQKPSELRIHRICKICNSIKNSQLHYKNRDKINARHRKRYYELRSCK